jgi:hypothetical protein
MQHRLEAANPESTGHNQRQSVAEQVLLAAQLATRSLPFYQVRWSCSAMQIVAAFV